MSNASVGASDIIKFDEGIILSQKDLLAVEEPLEIRLGYGPSFKRKEISLSVTMRTPGNDDELALGFLLSESIVTALHQVVSVRHCENVKDEHERGNVIRVELEEDLHFDVTKLERHFYTSSSCGVCGKTSIEAVNAQCAFIQSSLKVKANHIIEAPLLLREHQRVFEYTGGLHASGLYSQSGELLLVREDIGRHNALDKLLGAIARNETINPAECFILVSGRIGFELVQKAAVARIPLLAAVGAPSSLAVKLAADVGLTLVGFTRGQKFNIYSAPERIELEKGNTNPINDEN